MVKVSVGVRFKLELKFKRIFLKKLYKHAIQNMSVLTSLAEMSPIFSSSRILLSWSGNDMWEMSPSLPSLSSPSNGRIRQKTRIFP